MKILLTNDDGIGARGIRVLCDFAETLGEVTVVAPKTEQSAKSHGINIHSEIEIKEVDFPGAARAFAVDSTPADCVRFALLGLGEKFDLVLSGINCGLNIGTDIVYSGTVGAIFEAAAEGVPAVAVSTQPDYLDGVESHLDRVCDFFRKHNLLSYSSLYNVNIPKDAKDILFTSQGGRYYNDTFEKTGDFSYRQRGMCVHNDQKNFTLDTDATLNGYISVTPITLDRTDYKVLSEISKLKI